MYKERLEEIMKLPVVNELKENGDVLSMEFQVERCNPLQAWSYYKGTKNEAGRDRHDEDVEIDSWVELELSKTSEREFVESDKWEEQWKNKCSYCGVPTMVGKACKGCNRINEDYSSSDEDTEKEGYTTRRKPYRIYICGCDDSSYSKVFATSNEALVEIELIKRIKVLDSYEFLHEFGYVFTN